jgi:hypothetical protein
MLEQVNLNNTLDDLMTLTFRSNTIKGATKGVDRMLDSINKN